MQELRKILEEIDKEENKELSKLQFEVSQRSIDETREYIRGIRYAKDVIRKHMNDDWIPVGKDNIPQKEVLACDRYGEMMIGYLTYVGGPDSEFDSEFICESSESLMSDVLAWRPLPEPYKPEKVDKQESIGTEFFYKRFMEVK